jgi:endo-1,4-beta-D-glucanase Y
MKTSMPLLVLGLSLVAQAQNLLSNPDFESGKTGWTLYVNTSATDTVGTPDAIWSATASAARTGTKGASIEVDGRNANNWDIQLQPPQTWIAEQGKTYHLTFWGKSDSSRTINVAASRGPAGGYAYLDGWQFGIGTSWKSYEVFYTAPATGKDSLRLNIYVGASVGKYMFDDFVLDTVPSSLPATMTQPAQGAWYTGVYRNLFSELGYSQASIDAKIDAVFQQFFYGDSSSERLFYLVPGDTTMGFIDASGYVLTEGQSYGMMTTVQMDRKDLFDKLWKFAKTHMQATSGDLQGYFSWKVDATAPFTPEDVNPAPDGEEYIVTSLYMAAKRWGNGTGMFDYQAQADSILLCMTKTKTGSMGPEIDPDRKQIVFSPAQDPGYTDPSYHLPGFYRLWAAQASHHNALFAAMADTSWAFLKRAENATTGLFPEYASFDGVPQAADFNAKSTTFASDAHRVASNIGFSFAWFMDDKWATEHVKKQLGFFAGQGSYKAEYSLDGISQVDYGATSLLSTNAAAVLASDRPSDWLFVDALWKTPLASGEWRYYNGCLQMLSLLHVSGKFKAWGSPGLATGIEGRRFSRRILSVRTSGRELVVEGSDVVRLLDLGGREVRASASARSAGMSTITVPHGGLWILDAGVAGRRAVMVP